MDQRTVPTKEMTYARRTLGVTSRGGNGHLGKTEILPPSQEVLPA
jgi:hypothetical protein